MELVTVALVAAPILFPFVIGAVFFGKARRNAPARETFAHEYAAAEQQLAA